MSRRGLALVYTVLPPIIYMMVLLVAMFGVSRALELYDVQVLRKASYGKQVKFGRTPVIQLGGERYALLGIKFHAQPQRRTVILRDLRTNQIMTARPGQSVFGGMKVLQVTASQVTFSKDSQMVIIGIPDTSTLAGLRRI